MKKFIPAVLTTCLLSAAAITWQVQAADDSARLVSVETAKSEQVSPTMWLPGNVVSRTNAPISAEQTGQLLWIAEAGTQVEKGQVIARLDKRHLELQLAGQQARVRQYQADVAYLSKQKKRMSALNQKNNTALSELERIIKDLAVAESEVTAMEIMVQQTLLDIEKSTVVAPFSGNISERFAHLGELIEVGRPLVQLVDTQHLDIRVAAPIAIASYLQDDAKVLVKWQDKLVELPIRSWSRAGEQASRTFDVRLAADNLDLLAGSAVTVSLPKQKAGMATLVPRDALVLREKETFVLTLADDNTANKVNVLVGQGVGRWISVSGGISSGDNVIVRGGETLRQGEKVRVENALIAKNN
ncbi:efflux RND transporter periplasmic adaptor subunit [Thalassomonas viridans]|uniref:Efflux RND transporter periplasmic adaptor subunit n=1 Tax=Thalassomonas viridans TaxID=137584 RepID=A0AAF0CB24_9GAMM|nr:efflux RND transporter periplasmic adaptor subunit [Thalassomonas viridans]WDE07156.1 efflux RND transporter periplasmic adaptor subunit [Thalassomonas viridans]